MGNKGGTKHLKRPAAPRFWAIPRKRMKWVVKPRAGPHDNEHSIPLAVVVRDMLRVARTGKEIRILLSQRKVKVDGRIQTDHKYPVGLMDTIEIPEARIRLRVIPATKKGLTLVDIPKEEASFKLCRIADKSTVKKGNIQLNLHDSRNLLLKVQDPRKPIEDVYSTRDTIQLSIPEQKVMKHLKLAEGSYVITTGGANVGRHGRVLSIELGSAARRMAVEVEASDGGRFRTIGDYIFVLGDETPIIELGGKQT